MNRCSKIFFFLGICFLNLVSNAHDTNISENTFENDERIYINGEPGTPHYSKTLGQGFINLVNPHIDDENLIFVKNSISTSETNCFYRVEDDLTKISYTKPQV